jgi:hypothetical protein
MSEPQRGTLAEAIKSLKRVSRRLMAKQNTSGRSDTTTSMCLGGPHLNRGAPHPTCGDNAARHRGPKYLWSTHVLCFLQFRNLDRCGFIQQ